MESQPHTHTRTRMHSYTALFFRTTMKRVSETQMVYNYRNLLLSKPNGTETTRRYHLRGANKRIWLGHKIVQLCYNMQYAWTRPPRAYFADTVLEHSLDARGTSGRRQNQSLPIRGIVEWRFGILCLNISLFKKCVCVLLCSLLFEAWTKNWTPNKGNGRRRRRTNRKAGIDFVCSHYRLYPRFPLIFQVLNVCHSWEWRQWEYARCND